MRIELKDILILFEKLQEQTNISYVSIVIFCGVDIDSLCSLKIFTKLFKSENIQYKVYPVTSYTQLSNKMQEALIYNKVKLFLMINCGGIIDLSTAPILSNEEAQIFLLDIHKPTHHANIASLRVKVIDDGFSQLQNCPAPEIFQKVQELHEYELDSDSEDYDNTPKARQQRQVKAKLKTQRELYDKTINNYYSHNFFGQPSSHSAYRLVRDLNKANNDYLWFAIVGLTSVYLQQKISKEGLDRLSQSYQTDVAKLNNQVQAKERGEIMGKKGYQFALLDHWSLYESMLHSAYLMARLELWQDRGLNKLHEFIHSIGISLQDAKQLYKYMPIEAQRKLNGSIFTAAQKFGLLEITYLSFARNLDYSSSYMASDLVHVLTSVLEAPPSNPLSHAELPQHLLKCFWQAYDVCDAGAKIVAGKVQECKRGLRILMTEARHIMERDHVITTNSISIANIRGDSQDRLIFQHPSALIRLAHLLMAIIRQRKRSRVPKPLVANWIGTGRDICVSVGVTMDHKSSIGQRFSNVAIKLGIEVDQDSFIANVIIFSKEHLSSFIKEISKS